MTPNDLKLLRASIIIFGFAGLVFAGQFLFANLPYKNPIQSTDNSIQKEQLVRRCREMREKLRPWAEKNQVLLREMLNAKPEETQKLEKIWQEIPVLTVARNGNDNDVVVEKINVSTKEFYEPVFFMFIGGRDRLDAITDDSAVRDDPQYQKDKEFANEVLQKQKKFYWEKFRDLPWIEGHLPGGEGCIVWVSGRITHYSSPRNNGLYTKESLSKIKEIPLKDKSYIFNEVERVFSFIK